MDIKIEKRIFCKIIEKDGYQMLVQKEYDGEKDEDVVSITQSTTMGSMTRTLSGFPSTEVRDAAYEEIGEEFLQHDIDNAEVVAVI